jgi:ABC-type amino acid transport substrate-binding protein
MKKKILLTLMVLFVALGLTSCNKAHFDPSKKTLVVGMECAYEPYNWTENTKSETNVAIKNQTGHYAEGYDIAMAKRMCNELGYELVIQALNWDGLVPALLSGKIDAIIAGMSPTEKRKETISFTDEYWHSVEVLLVRKDGAYTSAKNFADLNGAKVIGQKGTLYEQLASQIHEKNSTTTLVSSLDSVPKILVAMDTGKVDITVVEEPVAKSVVQSNPDLYTYVTLEEEFTVDSSELMVSIGVRKVDTDLLLQLNTALSHISQTERDEIMLNAVGHNA